jgi:hypothetical protein
MVVCIVGRRRPIDLSQIRRRQDLQALLAKFLQHALAQKIGIALAGFRKLDDPPGEHVIGAIAAIRKPQSYASHLECDAHDSPGLGIEF